MRNEVDRRQSDHASCYRATLRLWVNFRRAGCSGTEVPRKPDTSAIPPARGKSANRTSGHPFLAPQIKPVCLPGEALRHKHLAGWASSRKRDARAQTSARTRASAAKVRQPQAAAPSRAACVRAPQRDAQTIRDPGCPLRPLVGLTELECKQLRQRPVGVIGPALRIVRTEVDRPLKIGDGFAVAGFIGKRIPKTAIDGPASSG